MYQPTVKPASIEPTIDRWLSGDPDMAAPPIGIFAHGMQIDLIEAPGGRQWVLEVGSLVDEEGDTERMPISREMARRLVAWARFFEMDNGPVSPSPKEREMVLPERRSQAQQLATAAIASAELGFARVNHD